MTTSTETVVNRALGGNELKSILRADFERLLDGEGLLSHYLAYGRISYDITLRLHLDNPMARESTIAVASKPSAEFLTELSPLTAPSPEAVVGATNISRSIDSPNAERLRHGLPLPVVVRQPDGTVTTEHVKYPPQPELGPGNVTMQDASAAARAAWGLSEPAK